MDKIESIFNSVHSSNTGVKRTLVTDLENAKIIDNETKVLNKDVVEAKINEFKDAQRKDDQDKISSLIEDFKEIYKYLGDDSKESLEIEKKELEESISREGAKVLSVSQLKNCNAKLAIIKYKSIIKEATEGNMIKDNNKDERKLRNKVLFGTIIGLSAVIGIAGVASSCNKREEGTENTTTTGVVSSIDQTTETITVTTSTGDYVVQTVDPNYSSPTRETTDPANNSNTNGNGGTGNNGNSSPDATTESLKNTTPNGEVTVISGPTSPSTQPVSNETTTVQTDINGTQPGATEPEIKPTGNETLPVEPTKITVDVNADPTPAPTKAPTETTAAPTEATKAPTETTKAPTPVPTKKPTPVPVETVDPNDPDNVIEKTSSKSKGKALALRLN